MEGEREGGRTEERREGGTQQDGGSRVEGAGWR